MLSVWGQNYLPPALPPSRQPLMEGSPCLLHTLCSLCPHALPLTMGGSVRIASHCPSQDHACHKSALSTLCGSSMTPSPAVKSSRPDCTSAILAVLAEVTKGNTWTSGLSLSAASCTESAQGCEMAYGRVLPCMHRPQGPTPTAQTLGATPTAQTTPGATPTARKDTVQTGNTGESHTET